MYIYKFKYISGDEQLCLMESKYIFGRMPKNKYIFVDSYIDVNRSAFVKYCLKVLIEAPTMDNLIYNIKQRKLAFESFKVVYLDILDKKDFTEKREAEYAVGYEIIGQADVHNPSVIFGISQIMGRWYFGEYIPNNGQWHKHDSKPRKYSNSLPAKVARAIINIASDGGSSKRIVDPCCGVGTVVLEALSMGISIRGYDINYKVVKGARENLSFYNYPQVVSKASIHDLHEHYDVAIIDIPYGIMSDTTEEKQLEIIKSAVRIADRVILVTIKNMENALKKLGYDIYDSCSVEKGAFIRYISIIGA